MNKELIKKSLDYYFPHPKCELNYNKDYEFLLAVMLSAQCTDKRVNIVTEYIFNKYKTLEELDSLSLEEVENLIKSLGMYKTKAINFKHIVSELIKLGGIVPNNREVLESMKGVGRKTTNVVLSELYNEPTVAVDTHVTRVSKRLGLAKEKDDAVTIEKKLMEYFPKTWWTRVSTQMVLFGRYRCTAKKPMCEECKLNSICKYKKKS